MEDVFPPVARPASLRALCARAVLRDDGWRRRRDLPSELNELLTAATTPPAEFMRGPDAFVCAQACALAGGDAAEIVDDGAGDGEAEEGGSAPDKRLQALDEGVETRRGLRRGECVRRAHEWGLERTYGRCKRIFLVCSWLVGRFAIQALKH